MEGALVTRLRRSFIYSELGLVAPDLVVADFMDQETGQWDADLLERYAFSVVDIARVRTIPVECLRRDDVLAWRFMRFGMYSAISVYNDVFRAC